jgi:Family of unknown function (DUF5946)
LKEEFIVLKDIMQTFLDQAEKNGITLLNEGPCQCCGAMYERGIFECMEHYNNGMQFLDFNEARNHRYIFLSVDAHALQHPEIHGRWSNHFHLTRLHLLFAKNQTWNYQKSPLLSNYLNEYKSLRPQEVLNVPLPTNRGKLTNKEISEVKTADECKMLIENWAKEVYIAYNLNLAIVEEIAKGFLNKHG